MTDKQTIKYVEANKAALADFLRKPIALEEWDSEVADGMLRFKERVKTKAKEQGAYILVAGGIEQEYCQNGLHNGLVDICGFFALEAPKLRGGLPEHKYMVLTPACNDPHSPILIVGTPVGIYRFHKEIVKDLTDCLGLDVRQWGGGYYEGFCPKGKGSPVKSRVYGKSQDFGEFMARVRIEHLAG